MTESELRRFIAKEVERQVNVILSGVAGTTTDSSEDINDLFPGMPGIVGRPVMQPFGVSSRAPNGTISVVARQGAHAGNRIVLGHRDKAKPSVAEGETKVYSVGNFVVHLTGTSVKVGKDGDLETAVVGETLVELLSALLDELKIHTHAAPGAPPTDAAQFTSMKSTYLSSGKILAKTGGRY